MQFITPRIRPNASGAATVSSGGKQVGKYFITNLIIIIKVRYLLYFFVELVWFVIKVDIFGFNWRAI